MHIETKLYIILCLFILQIDLIIEKIHIDILINFNLPPTETDSDLFIETDIYYTHSNFFEDASILLPKTSLESHIFNV